MNLKEKQARAVRLAADRIRNPASYGSTDSVTVFRMYCGMSIPFAVSLMIDTSDREDHAAIY